MTTISSGNTIRIPKTAIRIPQVRNRRCHSGRIPLRTLAFTMALSKLSEISRTARTATTTKMVSIPPRVSVVCQPRTAPKARPSAVMMKAQRK